jgi:hypothetical protein
MLRPDLWWRSAARVEIDHRARETRLRLEHLERLLIARVLPTRSWPDQPDYRRGPRFFRGGRRVQSRSAKITPTGMRRPQPRDIRTEACIAATLAVKGVVVGLAHGPSAA